MTASQCVQPPSHLEHRWLQLLQLHIPPGTSAGCRHVTTGLQQGDVAAPQVGGGLGAAAACIVALTAAAAGSQVQQPACQAHGWAVPGVCGSSGLTGSTLCQVAFGEVRNNSCTAYESKRP